MGIIYRQSLKGSIATFSGALVGFVVTFFVLTRFLSAEEIGLIRIITEAATLLVSFALLGTQTSLIRYYPFFRTKDGSDRGFAKIAFLIPLAGTILFGLLFLLFRDPIVSYFSGEDGDKPGGLLFRKYAVLVLPMMIFLTLITVEEVYASIHRRVAVPKLIREVVLRVLLGCCYVLFGLKVIGDFPGLMTYYVLSHGLCALIGFIYVLKLTPCAWTAGIVLPEKRVRKDFLTYSSLTLLSALGSNVATRLDLFMVSAGMGFDFGGIFAIMILMVAVIEMPGRALLSISGPMVSSLIHEDDRKGLSELYLSVSQQQLLIGSILFLLIWNNIDLVFRFIPNGAVYSQGKWVFLLLGIGKLIDLSFSFGNSIIRYSKYYVWSLAYTFLVTILSIWLNSLLIPRLGMEGAATATVLTFVLTYTFQQIVLWTKMRLSPLHTDLIVLFAVTLLGLAFEHYVLGRYFSELTVRDILLKNVLFVLLLTALLWRVRPFQVLIFKTKEYLSRL